MTRRRRSAFSVRRVGRRDALAGARRGIAVAVGVTAPRRLDAAVRHRAGRPGHRQGPGRLRRPVHRPDRRAASSSTTARSCRPRSARTAATSRPSVTDGGAALAIMDLKTWKVQQIIGNNAAADLRISGNDVGQEGPTYSPDGKQLWLGQTDGYRKFTVNPDGTLANPTFVPIPADGAKHALVGAAVFSRRRLHRVLRGQRPEPGGRHRRGDRRHQAELGRRQRAARHGHGRQQALRQQRGRASGAGRRHHDQLVRHPRCRPTR